MAFDITSVLKNAQVRDGEEQLERIDLDLIDPDPNNFYSLDGLDELAGNIELIGLQQPLRVRPGSQPGRYTIVSGHRRRAALLMIRDSYDSEDPDRKPWEKAACIVEYGEASEAMRELRLIYANAATRIMTSSEQSRQAERVTELLYQLKEQGVEFPGRMRDHVAEACQISRTKLARLHAIRANLDAGLLERFDRGEIPEETAYQLQRLPKAAQAGVETCLMTGKKKALPYAYQVEKVASNLDIYTKPAACRAHAGAPDCTVTNVHICRSVWEPYRDCRNLTPNTYDKGICCRDCNDRDHCSWACRECIDRRKLDAAVDKEKAEERAREQKAQEEAKQKQFRRERQKQAQRIQRLADELGLIEDCELPSAYSWNKGTTVKEVKRIAEGRFGDDHYYDGNILPTSTENLIKWAEFLECSTDYLLGRTDVPTVATEAPQVSGSDSKPKWQTGTPTEVGYYMARVGAGSTDSAKTGVWQMLHWNGSAWTYNAVGKQLSAWMNVFCWVPLPDPPEEE